MCKNMRELLQYVENKRKKRAFQHFKLAKIEGECGSFTDKEYKQVKTYQKSNYSKCKKHVYTSYWREYTQKYDVKQLKLIKL